MITNLNTTTLRKSFTTAKPFDHVVIDDFFDERSALALSKELIFAVEGKEINSMVLSDTAERIADARASEEGKEGVDAFLNKRNPSWLEK